MAPEDYKRFLNFLRKYQCHVPFQRFRMAPLRGEAAGWRRTRRYGRPGDDADVQAR